MIHAYDELYLPHARSIFAVMLDGAVGELGHDLRDFYDLFLVSDVSRKFARGHVGIIAGTSGIELACDILGLEDERRQIVLPASRSPEYWTGWALAFYQWYTGLSFQVIDREVPIEKIRDMYFPYHEMDILQFVDKMDAMRQSARCNTYLKLMRQNMNMTQRQLAELSGIPLKTLQQYEQGSKSINKAQAEYVINLSRVLCCRPEELLE